MSALDSAAIHLSAIDTAEPGPGELLEVLTGEVLVFAVDTDGRRVPLTAVPAGSALVGCGAESGVRLLAAGVPGTEVKVGPLDPDAHRGLLDGWLARLGNTVSRGEWPAPILLPRQAYGRLAPGQHVSGASTAAAGGTVWLQVTEGSAQYCDSPGAVVSHEDPAVPVSHGTWLTSGWRCELEAVEEPGTVEQWVAAVDLMGRLGLAAALDRQAEQDAAAAERMIVRAEHSQEGATEAVDLLTAAIGGQERLPVLTEVGLEATFRAAVTTARAADLKVSDAALERAAMEIDSGRNPVAAIAAACGARAREVTLGAGWWKREGLPLFVTRAHEGTATPGSIHWTGRAWTFTSGADGERTVVAGELTDEIRRTAIELMPVLPAKRARLRTLARLSLRGSGRELRITIGVTLLLAFASFVNPYLMGMLTQLFTTSAGASSYIGLFSALVFVTMGTVAWQALRSLSLLRARSRVVSVASGAVWERTMRQRANWHNKYGLGDRLAATSAVNNASATVPDETISRLLDVATVVGSLAAIATTNSTMLVALALLLAAQFMLTVLLLRWAAAAARKRVDAAAIASGRLMEILRAVNRIRVSGAESRAFLLWSQGQAKAAAADQRVRRATMMQGVVVSVWPILGLAVVIAVVAATGGSYADFVVAQTALSGASTAISAMSSSASASLIAREVLRKAEPTLTTVPEGGGEGQQPGRLSGAVEVRDLVLRYAPGLPPALDHVNLSVAPGEHVAIVGPSGCGKTTLMRAVLGLEEPESGVISVDNKDMSMLDRVAVRRQIGSVLQSSTLLPATIRENVAMGRTMTREQVWAALQEAAVKADVQQLAMGLDTPVSDGGGTLSGGQRQRILIARALAGTPRMLVLDEATSALDDLTQAQVVAALEDLRITRIVVAHRLSTIRKADRIVVMEAGRVVDEGTYSELLSRPGLFADLVARQEL